MFLKPYLSHKAMLVARSKCPSPSLLMHHKSQSPRQYVLPNQQLASLCHTNPVEHMHTYYGFSATKIDMRHFAFIRGGRKAIENASDTTSTDYNPEWWRTDKHFQAHKVSGTFKRILKVGPYKRGRFWVHPKEDPWSFVMNCLIVGITIYSVLNLTPGESMHARRKRIIRERLMLEYGLTERDLDEIEGTEAPLSTLTDTSGAQKETAST